MRMKMTLNNNIKSSIKCSWEATGLSHLLEEDPKRIEKIVLSKIKIIKKTSFIP